MSDLPTFDDLFDKTGIAARWEARAREKYSLSIAQKLIGLGLPMETIISATDLEPEKVRNLYPE